MARNRRKFSPEFKEEAAKMVVETSETVVHVARGLNVHEATLGNWVKELRHVSTRGSGTGLRKWSWMISWVGR